MMTTKKITILIAMIMAMSSCQNDKYDGVDHTGVQLTLRGKVISSAGTETRVSDSNWDTGDCLGVTLNEKNNNVPFASTDGGNTFTGEVYLLGDVHYTLTAYYPYDTQVNSTEVITFDFPCDYMWAQATDVHRSNPDVTVEFHHQMSKISTTITEAQPEQRTVCPTRADEKGTITLKGVVLGGEFNTSTGIVTPGSIKSDVTVEFTVNQPIDIILPPQTITHTAPIGVEVIYREKKFKGTISSLSELKEKEQTNYTMQLSQESEANVLVISDGTVTAWNSNDAGGVDMDISEVPLEYKSATDVRIGDYLLTDGHVVDRSTPVTSEVVRTRLAGVVFYVGQEHITINVTKPWVAQTLAKTPFATYKTCTTGLAVALENCTSEAAAFGTSNLKIYPTRYWLDADKYGYDASLYTHEASISTEYMFGFNSSEFFCNVVYGTEGSNAAGDVSGLATAINDCNSAFPLSGIVSGWYIPSFAEMAKLAEAYETVNASIEKAGYSLPQYSSINDGFYWCSTMKNNANADAHVHTLVPALAESFKSRTGSKGHFRAIVAFQ